jgi:hypothetical protein
LQSNVQREGHLVNWRFVTIPLGRHRGEALGFIARKNPGWLLWAAGRQSIADRHPNFYKACVLGTVELLRAHLDGSGPLVFTPRTPTAKAKPVRASTVERSLPAHQPVDHGGLL